MLIQLSDADNSTDSDDAGRPCLQRVTVPAITSAVAIVTLCPSQPEAEILITEVHGPHSGPNNTAVTPS